MFVIVMNTREIIVLTIDCFFHVEKMTPLTLELDFFSLNEQIKLSPIFAIKHKQWMPYSLITSSTILCLFYILFQVCIISPYAMEKAALNSQ